MPTSKAELKERAERIAHTLTLPSATNVKSGDLIAFTAGKHDDYRVNGLLRAKADLDFPALLVEFDADPSVARLDGVGRSSMFLAILLDRGLVERVPAVEFNLDD